MKITRIADAVVPIRSEISNAYISFSEMTASAVAIHTDAGITGYGFHSNGRYAQSGILRDRMIPRLMAAAPASLLDEADGYIDPAKAWKIMMANEKPGGHGERSVAVGTLDMALWDLAAKARRKPLYALLAERDGRQPDKHVFVYAAGGYYYPGKDIPSLLDELSGYLALGYNAVKIKIGGVPLDEDRKRIEAALGLLGPGQRLAVDANGRFDLETAVGYAEALNDYDLMWYEEPCDPLDFEILAEVAEVSKNPIATGENLFSVQDSVNLLRYGGLDPERDFLQMDPALSYGLVEFERILDAMEAYGWSSRRSIPHGGHQFALHLAAGLHLHGNESYPGVFQPFGGFADAFPVHDGRVEIPDAPGIGIECKQNLWNVFKDL